MKYKKILNEFIKTTVIVIVAATISALVVLKITRDNNSSQNNLNNPEVVNLAENNQPVDLHQPVNPPQPTAPPAAISDQVSVQNVQGSAAATPPIVEVKPPAASAAPLAKEPAAPPPVQSSFGIGSHAPVETSTEPPKKTIKQTQPAKKIPAKKEAPFKTITKTGIGIDDQQILDLGNLSKGRYRVIAKAEKNLNKHRRLADNFIVKVADINGRYSLVANEVCRNCQKTGAVSVGNNGRLLWLEPGKIHLEVKAGVGASWTVTISKISSSPYY